MFQIILHSKTTSAYLLSVGCPEFVEIVAAIEKDKSKAILTARMMNEHIRKFHPEKKGREYYYIKEV